MGADVAALGIDPLDLVDPARYARRGYPHDVWTRLRSEAPVARVEAPGYVPFWAVTKHSDVQHVSTRPLQFSSAHGIMLRRVDAPEMPLPEMVVLLDPPRHGLVRRVVMGHFTTRAVRAKRPDIERIATEIFETAAPTAAGDIDFVDAIAGPFPLAVMAWSLGAPRADWPQLYRWTNEIIGNTDPEFRRPGERAGESFRRARAELHSYLAGLVDARRTEPRDDLVSALIAGRIEGEPLTEDQLLAYCEILVEAGNETTRNAISGGVLAFAENPGEWERLRADPGLLPDAVEEILRWASPISHFTRVAVEDCTVDGTPIGAGDQLALFYASANRDEDVFDDPFAFRIDRKPNPHVAFGFGEHFCMGAQLARLEIEVMFRILVTRLESFEVSGPVERLSSAVNGGIKRLPLRGRRT
jgi:cholest-4-en-3-one 26-monooxygenase